MALINKQKGIGSNTSMESITTPLSEGELGLQQNRGEISVGTKNGNIVIESTELIGRGLSQTVYNRSAINEQISEVTRVLTAQQIMINLILNKLKGE